MDPTRRTLALDEDARVPRDAWLLGGAAIVPLVLCALGAWLDDPGVWREAARFWGASLLLFFSGVRRGLSFRTEGGPRPAQLLTFAVLFVSGCAALVMPLTWGLALIGLVLAVLAVEDPRAARRREAPLYFVRLRPVQMCCAVVAVGACAVAR